MKAFSVIIVVLSLTACSGMGTSGRSDTGMSGSSGNSPTYHSGFDPDNPYHGG